MSSNWGRESRTTGASSRWDNKKSNDESLERRKFQSRAELTNHRNKDQMKQQISIPRPVLFSQMKIKAAFYPKFESEKSELELRDRMLKIVSLGLSNLEVSLKHSGSLFIFSGSKGGAYAKNSYGNIVTAIGVFVLGRMLRTAWGHEADNKQEEFNEYLERNHVCVSMKLVTAVIEDIGQRPREDYLVVTAISELGGGRPSFYSTSDKIAFCQKWRLPTTGTWLFSSMNSVSRFFTAYDALREEGTATPVCEVLNEIADVSVPGSIDFISMQGEILEGVVVRLVCPDSFSKMDQVSLDFQRLSMDEANIGLGPSLREVCSANRSDENQQVKALLYSVGTSLCPNSSEWLDNEEEEGSGPSSTKTEDSIVQDFLQAHPVDSATSRLRETCVFLMKQRFRVSFKFYHSSQERDDTEQQHYKMSVQVQDDDDDHGDGGGPCISSYETEMRRNLDLFPLYRGFFVELRLFKSMTDVGKEEQNDDSHREEDSLSNEDMNLKTVLRFFPFNLRTVLMRDGLSIIRQGGQSRYREYYTKKMKSWHCSSENQTTVSKMLDEWAVHIRKKYVHRHLSSSSYLSEAEPFLANRGLETGLSPPQPGGDFISAINGENENEEPLSSIWKEEKHDERDAANRSKSLIVFFPVIPGSWKSGICREILNTPGGLGDGRRVRCMSSDYVKEKFWQRFGEEVEMNPNSVMLADKIAPTKYSWSGISAICSRTGSTAVPVVLDSEGTATNPLTLEALAVLLSRVVQRDHHPGNLDRESPRAGFVVLMFYHFYDGMSRKEFEFELLQQFKSLVRIPLLKPERKERPLPQRVQSVVEKGMALYRLQVSRFGTYLNPHDGPYRDDWTAWEKELRQILSENGEYLESVQFPFDTTAKPVVSHLRLIASGGPRRSGCGRPIGTAAVRLSYEDVFGCLSEIVTSERAWILKDKRTEYMNSYVPLARKRTHGVPAVASYSPMEFRRVPLQVTALLVSGRAIALEAHLDGEEEGIVSRDEWPHVIIWSGKDQVSQTAVLPQLVAEGKALRADIVPPRPLIGTLEFF